MNNFIEGYNYLKEHYGLTTSQIKDWMYVEKEDCVDVRFLLFSETVCIEFTPAECPDDFDENDEYLYIDWYLETNPSGSWKRFDVDKYGCFRNEEYI